MANSDYQECQWSGPLVLTIQQNGNDITGTAEVTFSKTKALRSEAVCEPSEKLTYTLQGSVSSSSVQFTIDQSKFATFTGSFTTDLMSGTVVWGSGPGFRGCWQVSRAGALADCNNRYVVPQKEPSPTIETRSDVKFNEDAKVEMSCYGDYYQIAAIPKDTMNTVGSPKSSVTFSKTAQSKSSTGTVYNCGASGTASFEKKSATAWAVKLDADVTSSYGYLALYFLRINTYSFVYDYSQMDFKCSVSATTSNSLITPWAQAYFEGTKNGCGKSLGTSLLANFAGTLPTGHIIISGGTCNDTEKCIITDRRFEAYSAHITIEMTIEMAYK